MSSNAVVPPETIAELRALVLAEAKPLLAENKVNSVDVDRIATDDEYLARFYRVADAMPEAQTLLVNCLKWRRQFGVLELRESSIEPDLLNSGVFFFRNRDKSNRLIGHLMIRRHKKDPARLELVKKYILLWFERQEKSARPNTEKFTLIFDMTGAGLGNLDMDLVKFLIDCFKFYYPNMLGQILVFEISFILNSAWSIIKNWLSPRALALIKFVNRKEIQTYVEPSSLLISQGGLDSYEYSYTPGEFAIVARNDFGPAASSSSSSSSPAIAAPAQANANAGADESKPAHKKRVSFLPAEKSDVGSGFLAVSPNVNYLEFRGPFNAEVTSTITLAHTLPGSVQKSPVAFKVKTTAPERYRVRPNQGLLSPGEKIVVSIFMSVGSLPAQAATPEETANGFVSSLRDKFLVLSLPFPSDANANDINGQWTQLVEAPNATKPFQHRLPCRFVTGSGQVLGVDPAATPDPAPTASSAKSSSAAAGAATAPAAAKPSPAPTASSPVAAVVPTPARTAPAAPLASSHSKDEVSGNSELAVLRKSVRNLQIAFVLLFLLVLFLMLAVSLLLASHPLAPLPLRSFVQSFFSK
ncbi:glutamyl-tRNA(Gln) amidotransferase B subunit [Capsaspora owczarzaki ATCC 30864]|uniref:Glutamyl-tRNA(Gln) amidotransferase B subunit n=1 Tax=Capsaspora owczarzaki (strain ATCC 30864) TaxID=595528 RepID=A0A0D2WRG3_CAPO3|nr:glutamyl-tRNA(Gln) amidotransferase B subunit [Capsaspora owczarzaki ATCC 30864]